MNTDIVTNRALSANSRILAEQSKVFIPQRETSFDRDEQFLRLRKHIFLLYAELGQAKNRYRQFMHMAHRKDNRNNDMHYVYKVKAERQRTVVRRLVRLIKKQRARLYILADVVAKAY